MASKGKQKSQKSKKAKKPAIARAEASVAPAAQQEQKVTRNALMLKAKERGIKNFRVLNKEELAAVLAEGVTQEQIEKIVSGAVSRWKAGWGTKKNNAKEGASNEDQNHAGN